MTTNQRHDIVQTLIAAGRRLDHLGLVPACDGNLSARLAPDRVIVTRTGVRKRDLTAGDFVETDLEGRIRGGGRASSELGMHLAVYRLRDDVGGVVHAHPPVAVGFASAGLGLVDCLMPEVAVSLGAVPLTPYATPGTPEVEAAIVETARDHDAFLLANHGAVTLGPDVATALDRMETLEHFARIALVTRLLGGGRPLGERDVEALEALRRQGGDPRPITCRPAGPGSLGHPGPAGGGSDERAARPEPAAAEGFESANPGSVPDPAPAVAQVLSDPARLAEIVAEAVRAALGESGPRAS